MHHPTLYNVGHTTLLTLLQEGNCWRQKVCRASVTCKSRAHGERNLVVTLTNKNALCGGALPPVHGAWSVEAANGGNLTLVHTLCPTLCAHFVWCTLCVPHFAHWCTLCAPAPVVHIALSSLHTPCFHIKRLPLITSSNIARQIVTLIKLLLLIIWKVRWKIFFRSPGKVLSEQMIWYHKRHPIHHSDTLWLNCVFSSML